MSAVVCAVPFVTIMVIAMGLMRFMGRVFCFMAFMVHGCMIMRRVLAVIMLGLILRMRMCIMVVCLVTTHDCYSLNCHGRRATRRLLFLGKMIGVRPPNGWRSARMITW